jgi:hypothetical protein
MALRTVVSGRVVATGSLANAGMPNDAHHSDAASATMGVEECFMK